MFSAHYYRLKRSREKMIRFPVFVMLAVVAMGSADRASIDYDGGIDCSFVRCFAACPIGTCSPRPNGACCDDLGRCSVGGCCGNLCRWDYDCKQGPCGSCYWTLFVVPFMVSPNEYLAFFPSPGLLVGTVGSRRAADISRPLQCHHGSLTWSLARNKYS